MLYGTLFFSGQVEVYHVVAYDIVLLNDVPPSRFFRLVGQIKEHDVEVFQPFVFFLTMRESFTAGASPDAPNVEQNQSALVRLDEFAQDFLTVAHVYHIVC